MSGNKLGLGLVLGVVLGAVAAYGMTADMNRAAMEAWSQEEDADCPNYPSICEAGDYRTGRPAELQQGLNTTLIVLAASAVLYLGAVGGFVWWRRRRGQA